MNNDGAAAPDTYFEDLNIETCWCTRERIVTAADIMMFANVSGDFGSLHVDEEYCRRLSIYGTRVAHGVIGLAVATGLLRTVGMTENTLLALVGVRWSMRLPIMAGDALHVLARVTGKRLMPKLDRGIVSLDTSLVNQRLDVVQRGSIRVLVRGRPAQLSVMEHDTQRIENAEFGNRDEANTS